MPCKIRSEEFRLKNLRHRNARWGNVRMLRGNASICSMCGLRRNSRDFGRTRSCPSLELQVLKEISKALVEFWILLLSQVIIFPSFFTHYSLKADFIQIHIIKISPALWVLAVPGRWFCPLPPHLFSTETHPCPFLLQCLWKTWQNPVHAPVLGKKSEIKAVPHFREDKESGHCKKKGAFNWDYWILLAGLR